MSQPLGHEPGMAPLPDHVRDQIHKIRRGVARHSGGGRRRRRVLLAFSIVLVILVAGVGGGYGYARMRFDQIASVDVPSLAAQPPPGKPFNLLVVGSDTRQGLNDGSQFGQVSGQRADVMILVRIIPATHSARLLSIPRDLYEPIAGAGHSAKINSAFDRGPNQLVDTIERAFGIPISHYLLVNFDGFRKVVDALGGVDLNFPVPVRDWNNGHNESGLNVPSPGCRHIDGTQALALARSRYFQYQTADGQWHYDPGFDLGRIRRQQTFLRVLASKALGDGLANPLRANAVAGSLAHSLTRDKNLSIGLVARLAGEFRSFDPSKLASQTIPTTVGVHQGDTVLRPGDPGFDQAWRDTAHWEQILLPKQPDVRRALDTFLNGTASGSGGSGGAGSTATTAGSGSTATTAGAGGNAPKPAAPATPQLPSYDPRPC
jgi:LCP family protein required for cell wall assembly